MKTKDIDVRNERTFVGVVNSDGTLNRGLGFIPSRYGLGQYSLRFPGAKAIKNGVAQIALGGAGIVTVYFGYADQVNINTYSPAVAGVDANFSFTVTALMNSN